MNRRIALAIVGAVLAIFGVVATSSVIITRGELSAPTFWGFLILSIGFVAAGIYLAVYNLRLNAAANRLKAHGIAYDGVVTSIDRAIKSTFSGTANYTLTATGIHDDDTRVFTKIYPGVRPFLDVGQAVTIYVDPENPDHFVIG